MDSTEQLKKVMGKIQYSYYLSRAIMDEFCDSMSKLTGEDKEVIKKRISDHVEVLKKDFPLIE